MSDKNDETLRAIALQVGGKLPPFDDEVAKLIAEAVSSPMHVMHVMHVFLSEVQIAAKASTVDSDEARAVVAEQKEALRNAAYFLLTTVAAVASLAISEGVYVEGGITFSSEKDFPMPENPKAAENMAKAIALIEKQKAGNGKASEADKAEMESLATVRPATKQPLRKAKVRRLRDIDEDESFALEDG